MDIVISPVVYYISSLILVIGVLLGINLMSSPKTAVRGNKLSAVCMFLAVVLTLLYYKVGSLPLILIFILLSTCIGIVVAIKAKMIHMPQMVAILNGLGGGGSTLIALAAVLNGDISTLFSKVTSILTLVVGGLTFSGSLVAAGKLAGIFNQKPVIYKGHSAIFFTTTFILAVLCLAAIPFKLTLFYLLLTVVLSLFYGYWFTIRIGGADMPITISLLNSFSGVAGSIAGMTIYEPLLVAIGGVIGASGLILTQIMCRAMNRRLWDILSGKTTVTAGAKETAPSPAPEIISKTPADAKQIIAQAKTVIIVPGYGMAVAQAQHLVKSLCDKMESQGKEVMFAIHPVAGRMPGHMNVLLAEAGVDYDKLVEMDEANPRFSSTDLVLVVGANDVVNPAANTAEGTPIYGMPILEVDKAKHVIMCNRRARPGYAGVENPLYWNDNSIVLLGDAQANLQGLLELI